MTPRLNREELGREAYGLREAGWTWPKIASELSCPAPTLSVYAKEFAKANRYPWPLQDPKNPLGPNAPRKFTNAQQAEIDAHVCQKCTHIRVDHIGIIGGKCSKCPCKRFEGQKPWPTVGK